MARAATIRKTAGARRALKGAYTRRLIQRRDERSVLELAVELQEKGGRSGALSESDVTDAIVAWSQKRPRTGGIVCDPVVVCRDDDTGQFVPGAWTPYQCPDSPCPPPADEAVPFRIESPEGAGKPLVGYLGDTVQVHHPTSTGRSALGARYALVPISRLITSHHPITFEPTPEAFYPRQLQERDYERDELEQRKVTGNAAPGNFEPDFLLSKSPTAIDGAPVIDARGRVLGGNSRAMVLHRVVRNPLLRQTYLDRLEVDLGDFGLYGAPLEDASGTPFVLVRMVEDVALSPAAVSRALNRPFTQALAPEAEASSLGRLLSRRVLVILSRDPELTLAQSVKKNSPALVRELRASGVITDQTEAQWLRKEAGRTVPELKRSGRDRLVNAIKGALIDDPVVLQLTPASYDALYAKIAPVSLQLEEIPGAEAWDINPAIRRAAKDVPHIAGKNKRAITEWLANARLFPGELAIDTDLLTAQMFYWLWQHRSKRAVAWRKVRAYVEAAARAADSQTSLFGDPVEAGNAQDAQQTLLGLRPADEGMDPMRWLVWAFSGRKRPPKALPVEEVIDERPDFYPALVEPEPEEAPDTWDGVPPGKGGRYWFVHLSPRKRVRWRSVPKDVALGIRKKPAGRVMAQAGKGEVEVIALYWVPAEAKEAFDAYREEASATPGNLDPVWTAQLGALAGGYSKYTPWTKQPVRLSDNPGAWVATGAPEARSRARKGPWVTQSLLVPQDTFSLEDARRWCRDHDFDDCAARADVEGDDEFYHFQQADPDDFSRIRTIEIGEDGILLRGGPRQ